MSTNMIEVQGVMWCVAHTGVVDECSDHTDEDGEPCCDMAVDGGTGDETPSHIVALYVNADEVEAMTATLRLARPFTVCRPYDLAPGDVIIDPNGVLPDYTVLERWLPFRDDHSVVVFCDPAPQKWTMRAAQHACVARLERS